MAAVFCEEYDGLVFNHNEVVVYKWIEEMEPELFTRIQELVRKGKWHIMGGWYLQPDCNMPGGESFIRQMEAGREYFREKFGKQPTTAINFDPFGHSRGLVQLMACLLYTSSTVTILNSLSFPRKVLITLPEEFRNGAVTEDGKRVYVQHMEAVSYTHLPP